MDDLLKDFLAETCEALDVLDSEIVELEQRPGDPALLGSIFRVMHTIKGTCGFLGLPRLEAVAHAAEDVLGRVRDGELAVSRGVISRVLDALDRIKELIASLGETGSEPAGEDGAIIDALRRIASGEADSAVAAAAPAAGKKGSLFDRAGAASGIDTACELGCAGFAAKSADGADLEPELLKLQFALAKGFEVALQKVPGIDIADVLTCLADNGWTDEDLALLETEIGQGFLTLGVEEDDVAALLAHLHRGTPDAAPAEASAQTVNVPAAPAPAAAEKQEAAAQGQTQTLRVNINVLEDLMTLVSELVLTRNQLLQIMRSHDDSPFAAPLQRLNQVTTELQESVMMTRMQPIGNAWGKLPRLVRDLSQEVGKKIELVMTGADTELDRQILESIRDPLTHMVRNSADHGIETAADRLAAGKPAHGTIDLSARHEGGHIVVVVSDDGRGLPTARIREKVLTNGLATETQLEGMSEQQIQQFIFRPGFSTAAAVTSVSGRGVGMDVVRNNIEKIGGIIEFQSTEGVGSRFTIKIPLTLAIVSALIVECEGERFALPQNSVVELVRINRVTSKGLESINGRPVYRLRDRLLPLVSLCEILGLPEPEVKSVIDAGEADSMYVVVSQVGAFVFGIIVDKVFDTEEIVVKPVSRCMRHISCFSGTTILGDGRVIMILDPNGLASAVSASPHAEAAALAGNAGRGSRRDEAISMLVFEASDGGPKAVPLSLIACLEETDLATAEKAGMLTVLQYRGGLMPLIDLDGNPAERKGKHPILVFVDGTRMLGLVVDKVIDIVDAPLDMQLSGGGRPGTLGSAIIAGAATDIIDTVHYLRQCNPDWFEVKTENPFGAEGERSVLLVEDSAFFRNLLIPMLTVAGYSVTVAEHAEAAISLCNEGIDFDVIVSDIEMPGLSGFDLVRKLRADERTSDTPIVALSSHASPKDIERGREAGFTDYVTKLDPKALLNVLSRTYAAESRKEDAA